MNSDQHVSLPGTRREIGYKNTGITFYDLFAGLFTNRSFILAVSRRDLMAKYRGAFVGMLWMVGTPAALVMAYGFMIIGVFNVHGGDSGLGATLVTLWLCVSFWQFFSESVGRSASIVADNASLVKRSPFPLTALPPAVLVTSAMGLGVSLALGLLAQCILVGKPSAIWLILFAVAPAIMMFTLACSYIIAAVGAFSKDIRYVLPLGLMVCMLMSPVLYPSERVPPALRFVSDFNPLTPVFETIRIIGSGRPPGFDLWCDLGAVSAISFIFVVAGFSFYRSKSVEFADVL